MEISALYHNTRPEGELPPQEAAAFDLLESLSLQPSENAVLPPGHGS